MVQNCLDRLKKPAAALFLILIPGLLAAAGFSDSKIDTGMIISIDSTTGASLYPDRTAANPPAFSPDNMPKALIIHADPRSDTLTAAARDGMANMLASEGWEVEVRSL